MDATAILDKLSNLGVSVEVRGDRLRLAPGSRVPAELVDELKAHKDEIISTLKLKGYRQKYPEPQAGDEELEEIAVTINIEGYILLWSTVLNDLVAFYRDGDGRGKIPPGFVHYGIDELSRFFSEKRLSTHELRLIHEAKRHGADVVDYRNKGKEID
jgi:hypothetical protein